MTIAEIIVDLHKHARRAQLMAAVLRFILDETERVRRGLDTGDGSYGAVQLASVEAFLDTIGPAARHALGEDAV